MPNTDEIESVVSTKTELRIFFPYESLEALCQALAEGDHTLGDEATIAGYMLIQWPGNDYPWGGKVDVSQLPKENV